ncbi:MAG: hypothetical protein KGI51_16495 [Rhodospirillales bacterium]|nr:hypothetical protein [Rhodospirillales bacterium]
MSRPILPLLALLVCAATAVRAQGIDLSQGGPIAITARDGITWLREKHEVIAEGDARAVRRDVTVIGNRLTAWYRPKASPGAKPPPAAAGPATDDQGGNEIYRLAAEGAVHIYTPTDRARCDRAVYDLDQAVLVMTGHDLRLTTPNDVLTARHDMEYWSDKHMAVARGDAVVVTRDARRIAADVLVAYTEPSDNGLAPAGKPAGKPSAPAATPEQQAGKLRKVEAFGHVVLRTATSLVSGDRGVYDPRTGLARLVGHVRITRGANQLAGAAADVDLRTGVATLLSGPRARAQGLIVPQAEPARAGAK